MYFQMIMQNYDYACMYDSIKMLRLNPTLFKVKKTLSFTWWMTDDAHMKKWRLQLFCCQVESKWHWISPPHTHAICLLRLPISCKFKVAHAFKWTCHAIFIWVSGCRAVGFPNTKSLACPTKWGINLPFSACCLSASPEKCTVVWIGEINSWAAVLTI